MIRHRSSRRTISPGGADRTDLESAAQTPGQRGERQGGTWRVLGRTGDAPVAIGRYPHCRARADAGNPRREVNCGPPLGPLEYDDRRRSNRPAAGAICDADPFRAARPARLPHVPPQLAAHRRPRAGRPGPAGPLRAGAQGGGPGGIKGVIMVLLPGGPTHLDTFDLKPDAPAEIRGEFRPIATNVPGIDICELLPRLARMADKLALIRSLVGFRDDHNTHWCSTGWESHPAMDSSPLVPGFPPGDWPSLGSVLSRKLGPRVPGVPPCVDLTPVDADARFILRTPPGQPGYLGVAHAGVRGAGRRSPQHHAQRRRPAPPRRPPRPAGQLRRLPPRGRCPRGRRRASTPTSGRPSSCSPRRGWPTALDLSREDGPQPRPLRAGPRLPRRARGQDATWTSSCWPGG